MERYRVVVQEPKMIEVGKQKIRRKWYPNNKYAIFIGDRKVLDVPNHVPNKDYFANMVVELLNKNKKIKDLNR